jgi:hypothetical protein
MFEFWILRFGIFLGFRTSDFEFTENPPIGGFFCAGGGI